MIPLGRSTLAQRPPAYGTIYMATGAGILVTANPGCHMQLGAGARMFKASCRVTHIVELLDESYRRAGLYDWDSSQAASDEDVVMSARMTLG